MGTFHVGCVVENHVDRSKSVKIPKLLVDTGSEYTGPPTAKLEQISVKREKKDIKFVMANGEVVTRSIGFAILRVDRQFTIDEVVFAEPGRSAAPRGADFGRTELYRRRRPEETCCRRAAACGVITSRAGWQCNYHPNVCHRNRRLLPKRDAGNLRTDQPDEVSVGEVMNSVWLPALKAISESCSSSFEA